MKQQLLMIIVFTVQLCCAQAPVKRFNWYDAGFKGAKPVYSQTVNIMSYGGNNTNGSSNNTALANAIAALGGTGGVVYFPAGVYHFAGQVSLNRDSITFKGAGYDSTKLRFDLGGVLNNCINVYGSQVNTDTTSFASPGVRDSNRVSVINASAFSVGQWVYLQCNDSTYMASSWAYGSLGQVMQIKAIAGNQVTFYSPFRFFYKRALRPKIKKIIPRKAIGFECLSIQRLDATINQTSLLSFDKAVQCWVNGIESDSSNYAHIELNRCANIEITNSYFHHAFAYGGSGQGYGIAFQYSASECRAENNIFQHLRHSMLFQAGANGNVCGYNYSFDPFWNQSPFPSNSSGDLVMHGNYPFANLCEGNINQNTVIDDSHGKNGPYNTFFRNRSELYGLYMNSSPATDTTQLLGLEITNTNIGMGLYTTAGNGNLEYGNKVKGLLTPAGTNNLTDTSLYYKGSGRPLCFSTGSYNWPILGIPMPYNTNSNPAKDRAAQNTWAECVCTNTVTTGLVAVQQPSCLVAYPNPVTEQLQLVCDQRITGVCVYSIDERQQLSERGVNIGTISLAGIRPGLYIVRLNTAKGPATIRIVKE